MNKYESESAACLGIEERLSALSISISIPDPEFQKAISNLLSNIPELELEGVQQIRNIISIEQPAVEKVITANIVPTLIQMSYRKDENFAFEVSWILCNIASGSSSHTEYIVKNGCLEFFEKTFNANPTARQLQDQIIWAIGNIAGDCVEKRDAIVISRFFLKILLYTRNVIKSGQENYLLNCVWTLSNCVRGKPAPDKFTLRNTLEIFLDAILVTNSIDTLHHILWGLSYVTDSFIEAKYFSCPALLKITSCLKLEYRSLLLPACRIIGNIVSNTKDSWKVLNSLDIITVTFSLMESDIVLIRKEAAWILSNLSIEGQVVISEMLGKNIYKKLYLISGKEDDIVLKEIIWLIGNSFYKGSSSQITKVSKIWLNRFLENFCLTDEPRTKKMILESLFKVYSKVGSFRTPKEKSKVSNLSSHCNDLVLIQKHDKILKLFSNKDNL